VTVPYFSGLEISGPERYWQLPQFLRWALNHQL
jgi:hypothetical protein